MDIVQGCTDEQMNYFRICFVVTDLLPEALREIFKREWDKLYKSTKGEWRNTPQNGMDFYNGEFPQNKKRNARLLVTMKNGDIGEWDCTMLFYAILSSDCLGPFLKPWVRRNVDVLREFRNEDFAHIRQRSLPERNFQGAMAKVRHAFGALGLVALKGHVGFVHMKLFRTEELKNILKKIDDLKQELQEKEGQRKVLEDQLDVLKQELQEKEGQRKVLEDQLQKEAPSFCILPPKPSHHIEGRDREVAEIAQKLKELKQSSNNRLSYLYISGNPGSGKSQLAGLVGKKIFDEVKGMPGSSFVMTLNCESLDSLLESYAFFARQLGYTEYSVAETLMNGEGLKIDDRIATFKMLISEKINCYTSWLLVADKVRDLSSVYNYLPQSEQEVWARGQLLIVTRDLESVHLNSSDIEHISVSKGMEPKDACSLLAQLSGITADSELEEKVAKKLDYQPLALASAAVYLRDLRENDWRWGWNEFLKILEEGKRKWTESTLLDINPAYPHVMTSVISLAVEKLIRSDKCFEHLFNLLSLCAPEPLNEAAAINQIKSMNQYDDEVDLELIRMKFRKCSLLLYEQLYSENFIRVHSIVYDVIRNLIHEYPDTLTPLVPSKIPIEIKARGQKAMLAYENALKTEKMKVYRARIILVGQDRAGKTSLKKSFLGLPFDPEQESTDGIEHDLSKFDVDVDIVKNWKRTDEDLTVSHFARDLARMVAGKLEQEEPKMVPAQKDQKELKVGLEEKEKDVGQVSA